jgi:hypothetical protein
VAKGGGRDNKIYAIIAISIIVVIIFAVLLSTNELNPAKIEDFILDDDWSEDIDEQDSSSQLFGLEKSASFTYRNNDVAFPAYVTVTSFKTLFMMSENELRDQTSDTIQKAAEQGIIIDEESKITGERMLNDKHTITYTIYDGNDTSMEPYERIKIIGESWNCGTSGTSVICIGFAQVTNNSVTNTTYWAKIIRDEEGTFGEGEFQGTDGLIFNVKCH